MMAPHASSIVIQKKDVIESDNSNSLYLVPGVKAAATVEDTKVRLLEENVRQLKQELAQMTSLLFHKEQLLQNFHVREQELKASLFHHTI